jgi:hypothetical protein
MGGDRPARVLASEGGRGAWEIDRRRRQTRAGCKDWMAGRRGGRDRSRGGGGDGMEGSRREAEREGKAKTVAVAARCGA